MIIDLFCVCWNDSFIVPFFLHHYAPICRHIHVFDNGSTDNTIKLLKICPKVIIHECRFDPNMAVCSQGSELKSTAWKGSDADWVIVVDMDEHIYHKDIINKLTEYENSGFGAIQTIGFDMISDENPENKPLKDQFKKGVRNVMLDKTCIFQPKKVNKIEYSPGCHKAIIDWIVPSKIAKEGLIMLHYRFLGLERTFKRFIQLRDKLHKEDKKLGFGSKYWTDYASFESKYKKILSEAEELF